MKQTCFLFHRHFKAHWHTGVHVHLKAENELPTCSSDTVYLGQAIQSPISINPPGLTGKNLQVFLVQHVVNLVYCYCLEQHGLA